MSIFRGTLRVDGETQTYGPGQESLFESDARALGFRTRAGTNPPRKPPQHFAGEKELLGRHVDAPLSEVVQWVDSRGNVLHRVPEDLKASGVVLFQYDKRRVLAHVAATRFFFVASKELVR